MVLGGYAKKKQENRQNSHRVDCGYDAFDENLLRPWLGLFDVIHHLKGRIRFFGDGSFHLSFIFLNLFFGDAYFGEWLIRPCCAV